MPKKKDNKEYIYCVFCGTKNELDDKKCVKCHKSLHPKNSLFRTFLYKHIKNDLKGKVEDNIISYLKNFIISHLYGIAMSLSIIFTAVVIINNYNPYKIVSSIDDIKKASSNEIVVSVYTYDDSCAADFDDELIDIPFTSAGTISGLKRLVYKLIIDKGSSINSWCEKEQKEDLICNEELYLYDSIIDTNAKKYREKVLEYASWVRENGISNSKEYAKWNSLLDELSYNIVPYDKLEKYDKNSTINKSIDLFVDYIGCLYEE